ncbi:WD40/YVTN/BNR-like repeat-containing protein [Novosphingobium soli]|uniref:WD40/YVTN/BNR-like repeat-containing protein n=1 Tax=Novosphingobium soli TaxID=574956 RepID=A0ABV6CXR3_9SPHN
MARDRQNIRFDQFVKPKRRWPKVMAWGGAALAVIAVATGSLAYLNRDQPEPLSTAVPRALSQAGGPVAKETYQWAPVAVGGGGFITGITMDPAGRTFLARADVYGAYVWDAKADRWQQLATAATMPQVNRTQDGIATGAFEVAVAPSRPDRLYMAIKGQVYRSDDRGRTWTLAAAGNPFPLTWDANSEWRLYGPFLAVDPGNPDIVLLGTPGSGVWRSADAGASWHRVASLPVNVDKAPNAEGMQSPGTQVWFETAGKRATGRVFSFVAGRGMYVSKDAGATFAPLPAAGVAPTTLSRGAFDRKGVFTGVDASAKTIWQYRDGAWHDLVKEKNLRSAAYAAVATDPRSDRIVVSAISGAGYISEDGGASWATLSATARAGEGDPPWLRMADGPFFSTGDLMFDAVKPNRLWVAQGMGVFYADVEPGTTSLEWVSQTRGIEELVTNDITQSPGHAPIFSAADFGAHIKSDLTAYSTRFVPKRAFIAVQQMDWTPADPNFLVTNASDTRPCCAEDGNAVMAGYSTDGGNTWTKFASLPTPPGTKEEDPWRMGYGTIAVSADSTDNIVWQPGLNRMPYYTTDRGRTWQPVRLEGAIGDNPGSFSTIWNQRKTLAADRVRAGTFYLVHSGDSPNERLAGVWRTTNGGASWTQVFTGEIAPMSAFSAKLRAVPGKAGHLFFTSAFAYTTDTVLRRSTDGGAHWSVVPDVTRVDDVALGKAAKGADYPAIYISGRVAGEYGIWRSTDNARSWQRLVDFPMGSLDMVTVLGADPDVFGRVYIGYKGSGWVWGEPASCQSAPLKPFDATQCSSVQR